MEYDEKTGEFRIRKKFEGWTHKTGKQEDEWEPISQQILKGLHAVWSLVCSSTYEDSLFLSVSLLAFGGGHCGLVSWFQYPRRARWVKLRMFSFQGTLLLLVLGVPNNRWEKGPR